jgi:hypothetical protein
VLRGDAPGDAPNLRPAALLAIVAKGANAAWSWTPTAGIATTKLLGAILLAHALCIAASRCRARRRRSCVRLLVEGHRTDRATAESVVKMFASLHKRLLQRWWRRLLLGQPALALEVHHTRISRTRSAAGEQRPNAAWLAVTCPHGLEAMVESALRAAYPNCRLRPAATPLGLPPTVLRLKKSATFTKRVKALDHFEHEHEPAMNRLLTAMGACGEPAYVQIVLTPTPALFERFAKHLYKRHEARLSRERREHVTMRDRSMLEDAELRGGLELQHRPLFFADLRVVADTREVCEQIASELRADGAENHLVERGTGLRHGLLMLYRRRVQRGEGNPLPPFLKGVFASTELAPLWHLPSIDYTTVPFARTALPLAPASPLILRACVGAGTLRDAIGAVSIHPEMRRQNTAVPGAVDQGKSSYLIATVSEDLRRERCAVIVLDPKGDAADAAVSLVSPQRTCTLLDFSHPTCGFNPLAVDAPADVIADYVVAALKNLFTDADIRASSDRYLRNAIIAVLAYDAKSTLWDAARLLSVGEEGYSYRSSVGARVRALPVFKEIAEFFTAELAAQLADARSMTTAKLDAPVNKLARLLNSASIKRVLLNESLTVDLDQVIAGAEVLVVKGALGAMGAGNTSVLMQLLIGMLDAALARQQDLVAPEQRVAVALKVDEAPLVLNRGFAETMALKRSAGLETVACWQTDAQWTDREIREQLDALFAHRVYFATASARDARAAVGLTMAEFSDTVRPGVRELSKLGHPDARLYLPRHYAIASWATPEGRQPAFIGQTVPLRVDHERLQLHVARQHARGGRHRSDLRQPHWDHKRLSTAGTERPASASAAPPEPERPEGRSSSLPATPAESYRELVELDLAHSVRSGKRPEAARALEPEALDIEILDLLASLGHMLSSQVHRRFNPQRASTTTQRRLKRLADAGLVGRFQFYRRDGGGVPMCYVITAAGSELLSKHGRELPQAPVRARRGQSTALRSEVASGLRRARHDVHVAGWALALLRTLDVREASLRGSADAVLLVPLHPSPDGKVALGPTDLRLPGGRTPHDFMRTGPTGEAGDVERFETLRPDVIVESCGAASATSLDVIVELDDRLPVGRAAAKLERYDHFLAGWSVHTARYGRRAEAAARVVFVCRDRQRARRLATHADSALKACRAYAGEYPFDWQYQGREAILFASERDIHEGLGRAYGVAPLPPAVRVMAAHGDPRAGQVGIEAREILG